MPDEPLEGTSEPREVADGAAVAPYEAPVIEDIDTADGPTVTAAGTPTVLSCPRNV